MSTPLDAPLVDVKTEIVFLVDDHIGALTFNPSTGNLYAANWDTRIISVWRPDGSLLERIPREKLFNAHPRWSLAIQDWKSLSTGTILASGFD